MSQAYKQSYLIVMESGKIIKWTGLADDRQHGEGLAADYAVAQTDEQVWDMCDLPVH